ncbi:hypothetical protein MBRA_01381 [Methylobacterium brachiatum]|nr:hypothetical protein MBRA_01381 [Methylobacterium brachiatum]
MSAALALAPPVDPSPPPASVVHDRSSGYRDQVLRHAVRRFADRVSGLEKVLDGLKNRDALGALRAISAFLAIYGYPGPRWGANGVTVGRVLVRNSVVVRRA